MILYSFVRCPYAMRARLALKFCEIEKIELREINLREKAAKFLETSPKGTVPVLVLDDRIIDESLDIMYFAFEKKGIKIKLGDNKKLIDENDNNFKNNVYACKYPDRYDIKNAHEKACSFLDKLEIMLNNKKYLIDDELPFLDFVTFPFVRQFVNLDMDWFINSKYDNLKKWFKNITDSKLFNDVMTKYDVWDGDESKKVYF